MKVLKPTALTLMCLAVTACNSGGDSVPVVSNQQALTYELGENSCTTGRQTFPSYTELCVGLQNNTLNNDCALSMRAEHFRRYCQGQSFSPFDAPVGNPSYPNDPMNPGYPGGLGQANVQISGLRNLYFNLDSSQNAGSVECYIQGREFHLELHHPEYANLGEQSRLLDLTFPGRGRSFPDRIEFLGQNRPQRMLVLLPGANRPWMPLQEPCELRLNRQGRKIEANFDCRLERSGRGRSQAIRMQADISCELERR